MARRLVPWRQCRRRCAMPAPPPWTPPQSVPHSCVGCRLRSERREARVQGGGEGGKGAGAHGHLLHSKGGGGANAPVCAEAKRKASKRSKRRKAFLGLLGRQRGGGRRSWTPAAL
eukprot:344879-Chlamydomonas_euryale.AAC.1